MGVLSYAPVRRVSIARTWSRDLPMNADELRNLRVVRKRLRRKFPVACAFDVNLHIARDRHERC